MKNLIVLMLVFVTFEACTQPSGETETVEHVFSDNAELEDLYEKDQEDRSAGGRIDWTVVSRQDSLRRVRVHELLDSNMVRTSEDYRHAAMVFQHGSDTTAARLAFDLARQAVGLDSTNAEAKWLVAASWDRYQMRLGKPQWYGTQFVKDSPDDPWRLYDVDTTAVSDEDRRQLGVRALSEARERVKAMNRAANQ